MKIIKQLGYLLIADLPNVINHLLHKMLLCVKDYIFRNGKSNLMSIFDIDVPCDLFSHIVIPHTHVNYY